MFSLSLRSVRDCQSRKLQSLSQRFQIASLCLAKLLQITCLWLIGLWNEDGKILKFSLFRFDPSVHLSRSIFLGRSCFILIISCCACSELFVASRKHCPALCPWGSIFFRFHTFLDFPFLICCCPVVLVGLQCFEGMKAYLDANGKIRLFRPMDNIDRLHDSALRLTFPVCRLLQRFLIAPLDPSLFLRSSLLLLSFFSSFSSFIPLHQFLHSFISLFCHACSRLTKRQCSRRFVS